MTLREIMVGYPASKDIKLHPYYQEKAGQWVWRFYHFRFTRAGRWFLGFTGIIVFNIALFWNLDAQIVSLALFLLSLWVISLTAFLPLPVRVKLSHAEKITAGEILPLTALVENVGRLSLTDLCLQGWGLPLRVDAVPEEGVVVGTLRAGEQRQVVLPLHCWGRGSYILSGCRAITDFPFGLLQGYRIVRQPTRLIVHPSFKPLTHFDLPTGRRYQPGGIAMASQVGDSFEYLGNREWREGDSPRDIDWRATARLAGALGAPPVVREWRQEYFLRVGVVLDTHVPNAGKRVRGLFLRELKERLPVRRAAGEPNPHERLETLERAISLSAAVSDALARQDYIVDIFAAGPNLYHLMAGRSLAYREQILDILACVEGSPDEPLSGIAPRLHDELDRITTVVCIVLDWDEARQRFVEGLREKGVGVKVIWVSDQDDAVATEADMQVLTPSAFRHGMIERL